MDFTHEFLGSEFSFDDFVLISFESFGEFNHPEGDEGRGGHNFTVILLGFGQQIFGELLKFIDVH